MKKMGVCGKIMCVLMLLLHKSSQLQLFNDGDQLNLPKNHVIGWMQNLGDDMSLSNITIPGTHDSLALHGGPAAKCQAWSLENQLNAGIRYFDLRVSGERLKIKHGLFYQKVTFPDAFETIKNFLSKYKTETVLVRVKPVFFFLNRVPQLVEEIIRNDNFSWIDETVPNIGQVRGKIVFVQKGSFGMGIRLYETDERNDYVVTNVETKKNKIRTHLTDAINVENRLDKVALSYSSGTGWPRLNFFKTPKRVAQNINPWLYNYFNDTLGENNNKACFGIIAMDFPGLDLIKKIIEFNQ